ncbi:MAG: tRNA dimethylallyltransferase [Rhodospirillaceae bacterium]|nr:MAG: tRNA dimethylallyltransferase [Rhodospirillaceae bacterium]
MKGIGVAVPPVIIVAGPTASGKSALALVLAEAFGGTVINADSMQVYRDLFLLTARPDAAALARAPHRLYGFLEAGEEICSVARWLVLAHAAVQEAHGAGRLPIVVGGTGLYLEALRHGLALVPEVPAAVRAKTRDLMAVIGPHAFHARLAERDPVMAARLRPSDPQRLQRAWEVLMASGRSLADWQGAAVMEGMRARFCSLMLMPPRPVLRAACDTRLRCMVAAGAVAEVAALLARAVPSDRPILKALGVSALADHIRGRCSLEEAVMAAQGATRRYAKRQCTWFRHHLTDARVIADASMPDEALALVGSFLQAPP